MVGVPGTGEPFRYSNQSLSCFSPLLFWGKETSSLRTLALGKAGCIVGTTVTFMGSH